MSPGPAIDPIRLKEAGHFVCMEDYTSIDYGRVLSTLGLFTTMLYIWCESSVSDASKKARTSARVACHVFNPAVN